MSSVDKYCGLAGREVIGEEVQPLVVESCSFEFGKKRWCVNFIECTLDVRQKYSCFIAVVGIKDPSGHEESEKILAGVLLSERPLCVSVRVRVFEKGI